MLAQTVDNKQCVTCKKLKGLMAENDLTVLSLSRKIGVSPKSLLLKISGQSEWYYDELISIVKHLGFSEVKDVFPELYNHILKA